LALPRADRLHLTFVDTVVEGADAFFPEWSPRDWEETHRKPHPADARHDFAYEDVDYRRR
jgi:dihydrofolate reductase